MQTVEVYETKPENFNSQTEVAACYLECDGKLLLLLNAFGDSEAGSWGVPAGKLESNEVPLQGAIRELFEETSISIDFSQIQSVGSLYIRKPEVDYVYHLFRIKVATRPEVRLSSEHQEYRWVSSEEMKRIPIMIGGQEAYEYYRRLTVKKRIGVSVNAYLILKQEDKILLHLRRNTGYCDGMWSLIAGHVEDGESATEAMSREAYEEIGVRIDPLKLKVIHVMHRKTNRLNVDIFFECTSWEGSIVNKEPNKCERIDFFSLDSLPIHIVDYNVTALNAVMEGNFYSESGWTQ